MIVAVGSDKGSPGATTLAVVLALAWPGERVLCELDPRGADLPFRLLGADGEYLPAVPSIANLAVDARPGAATPRLEWYAQPTALGVPVIRGEVTTRAHGKLAPHLPAVAAAAAAWPGTVLADLGSLQPSNPALVVAKAATAVLLVIRPSTEGLGRLRGRVEELAEYVGDPTRAATPVGTSVGLVVLAPPRDAGTAVGHVRAVLDSVGSPAPVVGVFAEDPAGADLLWRGQAGKKLTKSPLLRSGTVLVERVRELWPERSGAPGQPCSAPEPVGRP